VSHVARRLDLQQMFASVVVGLPCLGKSEKNGRHNVATVALIVHLQYINCVQFEIEGHLPLPVIEPEKAGDFVCNRSRLATCCSLSALTAIAHLHCEKVKTHTITMNDYINCIQFVIQGHVPETCIAMCPTEEKQQNLHTVCCLRVCLAAQSHPQQQKGPNRSINLHLRP